MDEAARPVGIIVDFEVIAENDGIEAFVSGEDLESNPFPPGGLHDLWARGWLGARARHER